MIEAADWDPCKASRMEIEVPRAHQRTVFCRRGLRDGEEEGLLTPLEVERAGTGLTNVGIVEGQGDGTLGVMV